MDGRLEIPIPKGTEARLLWITQNRNGRIAVKRILEPRCLPMAIKSVSLERVIGGNGPGDVAQDLLSLIGVSMHEMYGEFTRQWNLLERTLTNLYGNLDRVSKLRRYGQEAPHILEEIDERLIRGLLAQRCVYDEEKRTVKSYVRESYVFLRRHLGLQPDLCTSCHSGVSCDRSFNTYDFPTFAGALLLISYQVRCNHAHLGKLEETERNAMLLQFAMEVFETANKASGICIGTTQDRQ